MKAVTVYQVVAAFLFFLLVLVLLSPLVFGLYLKYQISSAVNDHQSISIRAYQLGWFSSQFELLVNMNDPIVIQNKLIHGPVYLGIPKDHEYFLIAGVIDSTLKGKAAEQVTGNSIIDLNMRLSGNLLMAQTRAPKRSATQSTKWLESHGSYSLAQRHLKFKHTIPKLVSKSDNGVLTVRGLVLDADIELVEKTMNEPQGRIEINLQHVTFKPNENNGKPYQLNGVALFFSAVKNGRYMNYQCRSDFETAKHDAKHYAKGEIDIVIRNVDTKIRRQLSDIFAEYAKVSAQSSKPGLTPAIVSALPQLLHNIELELSKFYLETPNGYVDAWLRVSAPGLTQDMPLDPIFLLSAIQLTGEASVAESIVRDMYESQAMNMFIRSNELGENLEAEDEPEPLELRARSQAIAMLESLRNQRYIDLLDQQYVSSIEMKDGDIKINDQAFNPIQWLMPEVQQQAQ